MTAGEDQAAAAQLEAEVFDQIRGHEQYSVAYSVWYILCDTQYNVNSGVGYNPLSCAEHLTDDSLSGTQSCSATTSFMWLLYSLPSWSALRRSNPPIRRDSATSLEPKVGGDRSDRRP